MRALSIPVFVLITLLASADSATADGSFETFKMLQDELASSDKTIKNLEYELSRSKRRIKELFPKLTYDEAREWMRRLQEFAECETDAERAAALIEIVFQRKAIEVEIARTQRFIELQQRYKKAPANRQTYQSTWSMIAQALLMSNEFLYVD